MSRTDATWSGTWVTERLGIRLVDTAGPGTPADTPRLADLAGLAVRRNPRRAHLIVSEVLGKHIPVDPRTVYTAGWLLGRRVAELLGAKLTDVDAVPGPDRAPAPGAGIPPAGVAHLPEPPLVVGYAETATALGHVVADVFAGADYLHSTRRPVPGVPLLGRFDETHSHATEHLLLPADPGWLDRPGPLLLVDDELSTGRTAAATIRALHALRPREHYVIATLLDLRGGPDQRMLAELGTELGARVDVVSLAAGGVVLPDDVLERGRALVDAVDTGRPPAGPHRSGGRSPAPRRAPSDVVRVDAGWPADLPDGGRHGFAARHRPALAGAVSRLAEQVAAGFPDDARILVLGTEEFMYAPLALACRLARTRRGPVRFSSTTRSPVLAVDEPGYAIRTTLTFPPHDHETDGVRYVYNVAPPDAAEPFDRIVLVVDRTADTPRLWQDDGLVAALRAVSGGVTVAVVPDLVPVVATAPAGQEVAR
ncbi:phosphoribosyltransferase family protein [Polymorphospora sp. NPDC051019]|uniref:phosphoribosyltransferase family protein n=1 Tax=Polymorphospora sp. NPDC051019 TaxID=3155725 RepID=UPI0034342BD3